MKEFNLEEAKKGAKVCTRDGQLVKELLFNGTTYPIIAMFKDPYFYLSRRELYSNDGKHRSKNSELDLMMVD